MRLSRKGQEGETEKRFRCTGPTRSGRRGKGGETKADSGGNNYVKVFSQEKKVGGEPPAAGRKGKGKKKIGSAPGKLGFENRGGKRKKKKPNQG